MNPATTGGNMQGTFVQSAAGDMAVSKSSDGLKVTVKIAGLTLYVEPADATLLGASLITVASLVGANVPDETA